MLKKLIPAILILLMPALVCAWPAGWNSVGIVTIGAEGDPNLPEKNKKLPLWSDPSRFLAPRHIKVGISVRW